MMIRKYDQDCPVARTLDIVGDRWTLLIIRDMFMGAARFSDFLERSPKLTPRLLSSRLKELKERGFVDRRLYSIHPLRAEYLLTERGRSLLPIILEIGRWGLGNAYEGEPDTRRQMAELVYNAIPEARQMIEEGGLIDG